jgi:hypothetical protein
MPFHPEPRDVAHRSGCWLREDRWLITGKTYCEKKRMREQLAALGVMPAGLTLPRALGDYGRRN